MASDSNPYAAPRLPRNDQAERSSTEVINAECVHRGWLSRIVVLSGKVNAKVRYEAWGIGERVLVNGKLVAQSSPYHIQNVAPHIDFEIEYEQCRYAASIDVHASLLQLMRITKFILTVDDYVVYTDASR